MNKEELDFLDDCIDDLESEIKQRDIMLWALIKSNGGSLEVADEYIIKAPISPKFERRNDTKHKKIILKAL